MCTAKYTYLHWLTVYRVDRILPQICTASAQANMKHETEGCSTDMRQYMNRSVPWFDRVEQVDGNVYCKTHDETENNLNDDLSTSPVKVELFKAFIYI